MPPKNGKKFDCLLTFYSSSYNLETTFDHGHGLGNVDFPSLKLGNGKWQFTCKKTRVL